MLTAIEFHSELHRRRVEIQNATPVEGMLTAETEAKLVTTQSGPKAAFCIGHFTAELARTGRQNACAAPLF
ncbi:MAG: hypothetical protein OEN23_00165 [Paracoccaceae bacterium]|nr:hypothetical protein [Paracoccaceae bacterium]